MTLYPDDIDSSAELPTVPGSDGYIVSINALQGAVIAIETELGIAPSSAYSSVGTRLAVIESRIGSGVDGSIDINGEVMTGVLTISNGGTSLSSIGAVNTVLASDGLDLSYKLLDNTNIASNAALAVSKLANGTDGYVITTISGVPTWKPTITVSGDLSGSFASQQVVSLTGSGSIVSVPSAAIAMGSVPATTGSIRLSNATSIFTRSNDNSTNYCAIGTDTSNNLLLGGNINGTNAHTQVVITPGTTGILSAGGTIAMAWNANNVLVVKPILGSGTPYGAHGEATINMANANYAATSSEYTAHIISIGSAVPMTANRTLTLPSATDATAYYKFIRNTNGGGFDVVVRDVSAGTTVNIADGFSAWVGIHGAGAFRMTADVAN